MANFQVKHETCILFDSGWKICLQYGAFDDYMTQPGYGFIWKAPDDVTQAYRGQSKIPSISVVRLLIENADREGWEKYFNVDYTINEEPF